MSRAGAIARAAAYFDDGGFLADLKRRVAVPSTKSGAGARRRAARLSGRRDRAGAHPARIHLPRPRQSAWAAGAGRRAHRESGLRHRAGLRPRRHHRRPGRAVARRARALAGRRRGRAHLWPRHRRQQRPAQRQHRRPRRGAGGTRRARLQLQSADRDGGRGRLGGPARTVRAASRSSRSKPTY